MPPMQRIQQREAQASVNKSFRQWADENLGEGSEWLDRKVRADELLNAYNQDTRSNRYITDSYLRCQLLGTLFVTV